MNRLIAPTRVPYGGSYFLNLPDRGMVGRGNNFEALLRSIAEWRRANSIPVGLGFESEVEQTVCEKYAAECQEAAMKPRRRRLSLSAILRGTKVLLAFKLAGSPLVASEEAEHRASICAVCPFNQEFSKPCGSICGQLKDVVLAIVGSRKTSFDDRLKSCGICECESRAHIHLPLEILAKGVSSAMSEQFAAVPKCWKQI